MPWYVYVYVALITAMPFVVLFRDCWPLSLIPRIGWPWRRAHIHDFGCVEVRLNADEDNHEVDVACRCGVKGTVFGRGGAWRSAATGRTVGPGVALEVTDAVALEQRKRRLAARVQP